MWAEKGVWIAKKDRQTIVPCGAMSSSVAGSESGYQKREMLAVMSILRQPAKSWLRSRPLFSSAKTAIYWNISHAFENDSQYRLRCQLLSYTATRRRDQLIFSAGICFRGEAQVAMYMASIQCSRQSVGPSCRNYRKPFIRGIECKLVYHHSKSMNKLEKRVLTQMLIQSICLWLMGIAAEASLRFDEPKAVAYTAE